MKNEYHLFEVVTPENSYQGMRVYVIRNGLFGYLKIPFHDNKDAWYINYDNGKSGAEHTGLEGLYDLYVALKKDK